jgi:hypothetical protein
MCVSTEDSLIVAEKCECVDSHAIPVVEYRALQITQVELSANTSGDEALTIGRKRSACQRLIGRV